VGNWLSTFFTSEDRNTSVYKRVRDMPDKDHLAQLEPVVQALCFDIPHGGLIALSEMTKISDAIVSQWKKNLQSDPRWACVVQPVGNPALSCQRKQNSYLRESSSEIISTRVCTSVTKISGWKHDSFTKDCKRECSEEYLGEHRTTSNPIFPVHARSMGNLSVQDTPPRTFESGIA
jgi:hypothetical protein